MDKPARETAEVIVLKKYQLLVAIAIGLIVPAVTVTAAYYKARGDIDEKIAAVQLQNTNTFAKNQDVKELTIKIDKIAEGVSEIKGYLAKPER